MDERIGLWMVTPDGTMIPSIDCKCIRLTDEEANSLLENYSDSERYDMVLDLLRAQSGIL